MTGPEAEPFTRALERMNRFQEPEARSLITDLALPAGSHGLDVGCGVGLWALWLWPEFTVGAWAWHGGGHLLL